MTPHPTIEFRGKDGGECRVFADDYPLIITDIDTETLPGYLLLDDETGRRNVVTFGSPGDFILSAIGVGDRVYLTFGDGSVGALTLHRQLHKVPMHA